VILNACLHNQVYDTQVEPGREQYLFDLISLTGDCDFYRDRLVTALQSEQDARDDEQIAAVLRVLAQHGDAVARQALYDAFAAHSPNVAWDLAGEIVRLDGTEGLLFVAERLVIDPDDSSYPASLVHDAEEKDGCERVRGRLAAAVTDPRVAAFVAAVEEFERPASNSRADHERRRQEAANYERLRQRMDAGDKQATSLLWLWAREADETGLVRAANDLLRETDPAILRTYLRLFHRRRFPLDPAPLIELTKSSDEWTAHAARYALTHVRHPTVRALALDLLDRGDGRGAELLVGNYEGGDYARIEAALLSLQDRYDLHVLGSGLLEVSREHPSPDAVPALFALYEHGPCANCRSRAIERLLQVASVPDWMRAECRYDADPDIRAMTFE
jgi:hypothetical protein